MLSSNDPDRELLSDEERRSFINSIIESIAKEYTDTMMLFHLGGIYTFNLYFDYPVDIEEYLLRVKQFFIKSCDNIEYDSEEIKQIIIKKIREQYDLLTKDFSSENSLYSILLAKLNYISNNLHNGQRREGFDAFLKIYKEYLENHNIKYSYLNSYEYKNRHPETISIFTDEFLIKNSEKISLLLSPYIENFKDFNMKAVNDKAWFNNDSFDYEEVYSIVSNLYKKFDENQSVKILPDIVEIETLMRDLEEKNINEKFINDAISILKENKNELYIFINNFKKYSKNIDNIINYNDIINQIAKSYFMSLTGSEVNIKSAYDARKDEFYHLIIKHNINYNFFKNIFNKDKELLNLLKSYDSDPDIYDEISVQRMLYEIRDFLVNKKESINNYIVYKLSNDSNIYRYNSLNSSINKNYLLDYAKGYINNKVYNIEIENIINKSNINFDENYLYDNASIEIKDNLIKKYYQDRAKNNINIYYFLNEKLSEVIGNIRSSCIYDENIKKLNIDINKFIEGLENFLKKQIIAEDQFLQGRSQDRGAIDEIKIHYKESIQDNRKKPKEILLKNLPEKIIISKNLHETNKIFNLSKTGWDSEIITKYQSFLDLINKNWTSISYYFNIFPEELQSFFTLDGTKQDFNKIKNSLIKIISFGFQNNNFDNLLRIRSYFPDINSSTSPDEFISGNMRDNFLNYFKDKDLGSKSERIFKLSKSAKIFHNFNNYNTILLESKCFGKSYLSSVGDIITSSLNLKASIPDVSFNILDLISEIRKKNQKLITDEYLSENYINALKIINKDFFSSKDLDNIVEIMMQGDYTINIRRFKYLCGILSDYSSIEKFIDVAKDKVDDIFSPNFSTKNFRFRVLEYMDPYHFRVGVDTNCCQTVGGAGQAAAIDSFINPKAGVVLLEANTASGWSLAAQSYFHYVEINKDNKKEKGIILDNIEAGRLIFLYNKEFYRNAYATLGLHLKSKGFSLVGCGIEYTEVINSNDFQISRLKDDPRHFEVEDNELTRYTDFSPSSFLNLLSPKFHFEKIEIINSIESGISSVSSILLEMTLIKNGFNTKASLIRLSRWLDIFGLKNESVLVNRL